MDKEPPEPLTPEEEDRLRREHEERMEREGKDRSKFALTLMIAAAVISLLFILFALLFLKRFS